MLARCQQAPPLQHGACRAWRPQRRVGMRCCATYTTVSVEQGKRLLDMEGYTFLDLRSRKEYDAEHLTKPPRCTVNVPMCDESAAAQFVETMQMVARPTTKLLVACGDGGEWSQRALKMLVAAGYTQAVLVEGGYAGWRKVFSTGGRRRPAGGGRWVPTGTEALKSGLPIPGVADRYEDVNPV